MLRLISQKYPQHLDKLYRDAIAKSIGEDLSSLADAVVESKLPAAEKREIFLKVAAAEHLDNRVDALTYLKDLDPRAFHKILISEFDRLPKVPPESVIPDGFRSISYSLTHYERLSALVSLTTESSAWEALERAMRRVEVGFRVYLLYTICQKDHKEPIRNRQLHLLARFLDDATVRELDRDWSHGINREFKRLEVRDYAAWQIAQSLGLDEDPEPDWTDAQWADMRANVKTAMIKVGIK